MRLGKGFSDQIKVDKRNLGSGEKSFVHIRERFEQIRIIPFFVLFVLGFGLLGGRLFWVMVVKGDYYREISEENRVQEEILWAPRGIIFDRKGKPLVYNQPVYRTYRTDKTYAYLTQEEVLKLEAGGKGKEVEEFISREYPFERAFAHVVGYVGEADKKDVEAGFRLGSLKGKSGLEGSFDKELRGENGKVLVETDAAGKKVRELGKVQARSGENLYTTLDANLQILAEKEMADRPGAVIASRFNGEILALYSSPSFDPNFLLGNSGDPENFAVEDILKGEGRPLFNRAIGGLYPPGSVFKPLAAIAGLESGAINRNTIFVDKGFILIGPYLYRNWYYTQYGKIEGEVDIVKGIARSVDTFFYKTGEKTGIDSIAKWGKRFGIGKLSGIMISGEKKGRMPDREWKKEAKGERWYLGDTYHVSIGQGDILATPLQVNMMTAAIANKGKLCKPILLQNLSRRRVFLGGISAYAADGISNCKDLGISKETLELVIKGMEQACSKGGTGFPLFDFTVDGEKIRTACKTGTAEYGDPEKTHAWFTVFAPVEDPEIVVTVLLEGGGSGAYDAAPVAKEILEEYFKNQED